MSSRLKLRAIGWGLIVGGLLVLLAWEGRRGIRIETNILELLPAVEKDPVVQQSLKRFTARNSGKLTMLMRSGNEELTESAAAGLVESLLAEGAFQEVTYRFDQGIERDLMDFYLPFRYQLLDAETRRMLRAPGGGETLLRRSERRLYSPLSALYSQTLEADPLLVFPRFLESLPRPPSNLRFREGLLWAGEGENPHLFVLAEIAGDSFSRETQDQVARAMKRAKQRLATSHPGTEILAAGLVRFARASAASIEREAKLIGGGSIVGILLLILWAFRSPGPLILGLLPIAVGCLAAFTLSIWIFGSLHLLTLGFGVSLVGVCIDYSFHFFAERAWAGPAWSCKRGLSRILPGITLGALTSLLGYLGLVIAPFPGLRQMGLFSFLGLAAAYGTVVCWFPILARKPATAPSPALVYLAKGVFRWFGRPTRSRVFAFALVALLLFTLVGVWRLRSNDDIRILQSPAEDLLRESMQVQMLTGAADPSRFFVVKGEGPEEVLIAEEALSPLLDSLVRDGALGYYQAVSGLAPSRARQRSDHLLLQRAMLAEDALLERYFSDMGFPEEVAERTRGLLRVADPPMLTLDSWLATPVSRPLRHLWLGPIEGVSASMVLLGGVERESSLVRLASATSGVAYVNQVRDISDLLRRYRHLASLLVAAAYGAIYLLLLWRYGPFRALLVMAPPISAAMLTLGMFGWIGLPLNLFCVFALLLVLGIGIDYTIFLVESGSQHESTMLAILLSAGTTLLSFGLLAIASTPVLRTFGLTVLFGILAALALAPLAVGLTGKISKRNMPV